MGNRQRLFLLAFVFLFSSIGTCFAADWGLLNRGNGLHPGQAVFDTGPDEMILLSGKAAGDEQTAREPSSSSQELTTAELHKYLGYTTILLAGITAVSSSSKHFHWTAAYGTAGAASLTVITGTLAHGNRVTLEDGWLTQDNMHMMLGTVGAAACIAAVIMADSDGGNGHAGTGIFGGAAMALSVVTIRW